MLDMDKKTSSERVQLNNETANRTITESQLSEQMSTESTMVSTSPKVYTIRYFITYY